MIPKAISTFLALMALVLGAAADGPPSCAVCSTAIGGSYFSFKSPTLGDSTPVCEDCGKIKERCVICALPVPVRTRKVDGGRVFCERDHRSGVFDPNEARRVFEEARRDVAGMLASFGVLPDRNITVQLSTLAEIKKAQQTLPSEHDGDTILGLTQTEFTSPQQFTHRISLVNGLPRSRLAAVCAHEYSHAWLHENVPTTRKLEKDTVEGFCELIAYKLMVRRGDEVQKKIILDNAYTRGQVTAFVESEKEHHFHRVVQWMKTGEDDNLVKTNKARVRALNAGDDEAAPLWPPPAVVRTRVPDTLTLKGISGVASRRVALVNDATLVKNQESKVRVGSSNVMVRCLDIRASSVVIQIKGAATSTELFLANKE